MSEETNSETGENGKVRLTWSGLDELESRFVTQFVLQNRGDHFLLALGQLNPPPFLGSPDEIAKQQREFTARGSWPVHVMGRYAVTVKNLRELHDLIGDLLARLDEGSADAQDDDK